MDADEELFHDNNIPSPARPYVTIPYLASTNNDHDQLTKFNFMNMVNNAYSNTYNMNNHYSNRNSTDRNEIDYRNDNNSRDSYSDSDSNHNHKGNNNNVYKMDNTILNSSHISRTFHEGYHRREEMGEHFVDSMAPLTADLIANRNEEDRNDRSNNAENNSFNSRYNYNSDIINNSDNSNNSNNSNDHRNNRDADNNCNNRNNDTVNDSNDSNDGIDNSEEKNYEQKNDGEHELDSGEEIFVRNKWRKDIRSANRTALYSSGLLTNPSLFAYDSSGSRTKSSPDDNKFAHDFDPGSHCETSTSVDISEDVSPYYRSRSSDVTRSSSTRTPPEKPAPYSGRSSPEPKISSPSGSPPVLGVAVYRGVITPEDRSYAIIGSQKVPAATTVAASPTPTRRKPVVTAEAQLVGDSSHGGIAGTAVYRGVIVPDDRSYAVVGTRKASALVNSNPNIPAALMVTATAGGDFGDDDVFAIDELSDSSSGEGRGSDSVNEYRPAESTPDYHDDSPRERGGSMGKLLDSKDKEYSAGINHGDRAEFNHGSYDTGSSNEYISTGMSHSGLDSTESSQLINSSESLRETSTTRESLSFLMDVW